MIIGAVLRLWQYAANSSLWIDEAALARNVIDRSATALLGPLDYAQVAPAGFLLIEKCVAASVGTSEYALRAFPLACGLGSLVLFLVVAKRVLSGWAVPFAVGLFSLGIPLIYFSSQVKQYSSDVVACLVLLLAALEIRRRGVTARRALLFGAAGAAAVWISQTAVFVIAGIGAGQVALVLMERNRADARVLLMTWGLWAASAAAAAAHSIANVTERDREYFQWFWREGFMPMPPRSVSEIAWLPEQLTWVFGAFERGLGLANGGLNYRWSAVFTVTMVWGCGVLWRRQRDAALFLLLPVVVVVCLSAVGIYPFAARLIVFLLPCFLLVTAAGAAHLLNRWPHQVRWLSPIALAILGGSPIYAAATALPPSFVQHMRPVLEHLSERRSPGDRVYVYYGAALPFRYHAPRLGLSMDGVIFGRCGLAEPRNYLVELDAARGAPRLWVVATHVQRPGERELLLEYLDNIGRRLDAVVVAGSNGQAIEAAYGYLYDLSDAERLASTSAKTFPVTLPPVTTSWVQWGCYGVTDGAPRP